MASRGEERGKAGFGGALARAGYAVAGALAAVFVGWAVSLAFPQPRSGMLAHFVGVVAMGAVLMLWASFKPSRLKGGSSALQALLVLGVVVAVWAVGDYLNSPREMEYVQNPLIWVWTYVFYLFNINLGFVLPASWVLGGNERWSRRPLWRVLVELAFALVMGALIASDSLGFLGTSLPTFVVYQLLFVVGALAAAGVIQRLTCELVRRIRVRSLLA
ncbi:hypothetical protein B5F40_07650 [Gordonibacter sp. An230]|uniref:hypothetical protein n=1 Tax=Gordonibacter sp. An230 TaxID=1965592 RepID=UPI000B3678A4|nr:hypothetical protein [Gordonibacter sp. An230]OUO90322.1 hypothetical protein B5F40_07650 [Gordonibacter sp. An230]